jgi:putative addiction module component (TIGR02574 family)
MTHPLLSDLLRLPPDQRLELAMALWDSIEESPEATAAFPLTPELRAELDRRVAEHRADPASAVAWEDLERQLLRG